MGTVVNPETRGLAAEIPNAGSLSIDTGDAKKQTADVIEFIQNKYDDLLGQLETLQGDLADIAKNFNIKDINTFLQKVPVSPVSYPSAKDWGEIILNTAWPTNQPVKPTLRDFGNLDYKYLEPVPPEAFKGSFAWIGEPYNSELRSTLATAIYNELVNGGWGMPQSVYAALIDREQATRLRNQAKQVRDEMLATGQTGFVLGMGSPAQKGILAEASKARIYADQDGLNAITEIDYRYYQQNKEFFHSLALELEKLRSGEWDSGENRRFEADRATFEFALQAVNTNLEVYLKKWDGIRIGAETLKTKIEAIATENKAKTDQYTAEHEANKTQSEAIAAENTSKVQIRGIEVDTWAKEVDAKYKQQVVNLQEAEFEFKQILSEVDLELRKHGINTDGYKAEGDLKTGVLDALSKITAQVVASTIGAINASASMGFSGSESVRYGLSDSASLSESVSTTPA